MLAVVQLIQFTKPSLIICNFLDTSSITDSLCSSLCRSAVFQCLTKNSSLQLLWLLFVPEAYAYSPLKCFCDRTKQFILLLSGLYRSGFKKLLVSKCLESGCSKDRLEIFCICVRSICKVLSHPGSNLYNCFVIIALQCTFKMIR